MLSYFAHIPHSPIILPSVSKEKVEEFSQILQAVKRVAGDLETKKVDAAIVLSSGAAATITANSAPTLTTDFSGLGDFTTRVACQGDNVLAAKIMHRLYPRFPLKLITNDNLDNSAGILACQLGKKYPCRLLPVSIPPLPTEQLLDFAKSLRDVLEEEKERIAIISGGDLARSQEENDREEAGALDKLISRALRGNNCQLLLRSEAKSQFFQVAAFYPLLVLLGASAGLSLPKMKIDYAQKFGVGLLVARLSLG